MKFPKEIQRYCPHCNKHTAQKLERVKTAGRRAGAALKKGTRRKKENLDHGYGGSPYPKLENNNRAGAKTSQKVLLRFSCKTCGKKTQSTNARRMKKFEIAQATE